MALSLKRMPFYPNRLLEPIQILLYCGANCLYL